MATTGGYAGNRK